MKICENDVLGKCMDARRMKWKFKDTAAMRLSMQATCYRMGSL
jgi:hypothetical protein